ncbi:MAG TPA: methylated-DNA--[protein]-cysteine S-methyltransferase [Firmicutes bacterium]|nr:methylated-DNA--[protein]-cysteine S-methyltransferase [Bacillota bacterium]
MDTGSQSRNVAIYTAFETPLGVFFVASTDAGVVRLLLPTEPQESFFTWLYKIFGPKNIIQQPEHRLQGALQDHNSRAEYEIRSYLSHKLTLFSVPLDLRGTAFQRRVWEYVRQIPYGSTASYGQVASEIGSPRAVRAVGAANAANPVPIIVPCHRVVGKDGSLTGYGGGLELKQYLINLETSGVSHPFR